MFTITLYRPNGSVASKDRRKTKTAAYKLFDGKVASWLREDNEYANRVTMEVEGLLIEDRTVAKAADPVPVCEICGREGATVEADSDMCADCSASWDDYCAMEYRIFLLEWESTHTGEDWRELIGFARADVIGDVPTGMWNR
jgi:hypothetical protein